MGKKARKSPTWAVVVVVIGAILTAVGGGGAVTIQVLAARYAGAVQTENLFGDGGAVSEEEAESDIKGPLNFLMVGIDPRKPETPPLADSIMVVHIPAGLDSAYIFSIPRDTYVEIPAFAKAGTGAQRGKINGAMSIGSRVPGQQLPSAVQGFELLSKTVSQLTGIKRFDAGAIINFDGFKKVVDAMGGIDLYVDERTVSEHLAPDGSGRPYRPQQTGNPEHPYVGPKKTYEVGNKHFKGWEALDFARQRYGLKGTDYGRQRHQQQVLKAIAKKASSGDVVANPVKLDKVLTAAGKSLTFSGRGRTVLDYAFALKGMRPDDITTIKLAGGRFPVSGAYLGEKLTSASEELFEALRAERIDDFLVNHPQFLSTK